MTRLVLQMTRGLSMGDTNYEARARKMQDLAVRRQEVTPVQLPIWPDPQRVTANALLRSALFSCARKRRFTKEELIACWPDTEIRFSGETLNQFDESVWMQLVHMFRQQGEPSDFKVRLNAKAFLRSLGKKSSGGSHVAVLRESMIRLCGGIITLTHREQTYGGGVLLDFTIDDSRGFFVASINPRYLRLLETSHTRLDWQTRLALPTGLSTWLHRYIVSHQATGKQPHRIGLQQLHELSGMASSPKHFKSMLRDAMLRLKKLNVVSAWCITAGEALEFARPSQKQDQRDTEIAPPSRNKKSRDPAARPSHREG